jgi:glycosyltransferase involved in cell wall biosynthesis
MSKRIVSLVINNFKNDNRVHRMALSLSERGHTVRVVGLCKGDVAMREIANGVDVHRIRVRSLALPDHNKFFGAIKYTEYFIRVILLYRKWDIWHCNDFEAFLLGLMAKLTRPRLILVYDCHEYEAERYSLGKWMRKFVSWGERNFIRYAAMVITVGPSIMREYERLYGTLNIHLVRNTPHLKPIQSSQVLRQHFGIRPDQKIFLYQGMISGGRGIEVLLEAFSRMPDDRCVLVVMGYGALEELVRKHAESSAVIFFHPAVPYGEINRYSGSADVGLNTPQNHCLSYYYCLPNKLFEYIQSGIPVLTNNLPDCRSLVEGEQIGEVIEEFTPAGVAQAVSRMAQADLTTYRSNLLRAREKYHWDEEVKAMHAAYSTIGA